MSCWSKTAAQEKSLFVAEFDPKKAHYKNQATMLKLKENLTSQWTRKRKYFWLKFGPKA
jgi:hypothetical protein